MILSKLTLSRQDIENIKKNNNHNFDAYTVHKLIYSLFPQQNGKTRDFLFVELAKNHDGIDYLIVSELEPIPPNHGELIAKIIPEDFFNRTYYRFAVLVNPTKRKEKKIIGLMKTAEIEEWIDGKGEQHGIEFVKDKIVISQIGKKQIETKGQKISYAEAKISGILKVIDREKFTELAKKGLGRGKAFGYGLMQLQPITFKNN